MTEQRRVRPFFRTGEEQYYINEHAWIQGDLDAPDWLPCGSTIEIPPDEGSEHPVRLIADRVVSRQIYRPKVLP